jgi:large subunit ribosomal protein L6
MKCDLNRTIEIPAGISVGVDGDTIKMSKEGKEIVKNFNIHKMKMEVVGTEFKISAKNATKRESTMLGTIEAHVKNMVKGLQENFVYEMEICNVHFPMIVKVEGDEFVVKSFLGEKRDRIAKILKGVKVDVKGQKVEITSHDIEAAGQTAANIEQATKLTGRDRRIFQDGIFMTVKPYKVF